MPSVVVDTCVLSYLYNGHSLAENYRSHLEGNTAVISFMTLAELHYVTLNNNWGESRRADLMTHVAHEYVTDRSSGVIFAARAGPPYKPPRRPSSHHARPVPVGRTSRSRI